MNQMQYELALIRRDELLRQAAARSLGKQAAAAPEGTPLEGSREARLRPRLTWTRRSLMPGAHGRSRSVEVNR